MSLSELEILSQHQASLRQAAERCRMLQQNAVETNRRGWHYLELKEAMKRIEGTARQMAHWRGDTRWLALGFVYARAQPLAQRLFNKGAWLKFGELQKLFEKGIRNADQLAHRKTERPGTLILPPQTPKEGLILPPAMLQ